MYTMENERKRKNCSSQGKIIVKNQTANSLGKNNHKTANFNNLQWDAGGLSQEKENNIQMQLDKYDIDVFFITESNISEQNQIYYKFKNYKSNCLFKSRQIASGILVSVKNNVTHNFKIIKEMTNDDSSESVQVKVWKDDMRHSTCLIYSPPNNPHLDMDAFQVTKNNNIWKL